MFTVIICDKAIINDCKRKYKIHFKPLLENEEIAFCSWYPHADTLDEAVPELENLIKGHAVWRAVVVNDRRVISDELLHKPNPFDYIGTEKYPVDLDDEAGVLRYRDYVERTANEATENPVTRLSIWLNGYSTPLRPDVAGEEILKSVRPFSDEYNALLEQQKVSVVDLETSYARAKRFDTVSEKFLIRGEMFCPPQTVLVVSERAMDIDLLESAAAWSDHNECDYSKYAEDNLFSSKMRCIVYTLPRIKGRIKELDYFVFLSTLLIFAGNEASLDLMRPGRVYELSAELDIEKLRAECNDYLYKLDETLQRINDLKSNRRLSYSRPLDDIRAKKEFESDIVVPVQISTDYDKSTLLCDYKEIGMSADCPQEEDQYWSSQYKKIKKHFARFLKQPYRAIKTAVVRDLPKMSSVDDLRAKRLSDFQKEDVKDRLNEEEQNMVAMSTSRIFDRNRYDEMLEDANKEVKKGISQRMTKKKTLTLAFILLSLSIFGFIPLFISEVIDLGSAAMSLLLLLTNFAIIAGGMIAVLFTLRRKLVNKFKRFNQEIDNIYSDISGSLSVFSEYLSHTCNVMRQYAVLNIIDQENDKFENVYLMHEYEIECCIGDIVKLFPEYIEANYHPEKEIEPFDYDFNVAQSYEYDITYDAFLNQIQFLNEGNSISIPVDYIKRIKLKREEFYD